MLANRVREYSTTVGTGDLTLMGAMTGFVRFSDAFGLGDQVAYVIEDGGNFEVGTGTLTAADTLARTSVLETLEGGVHTKGVGAGPISLSGNARILCTLTTEYITDPDKQADIIRELTPGAGVTVEDVLIKAGDVTALDVGTQTAAVAGTLTVGGAFTASGPVTVNNDFTVAGTMTVNGDLVTNTSYQVAIGDSILELNAGLTGAPTTDAGLLINRGTSPNVSFEWIESLGQWQASNDLDVIGALSATSLTVTGDIAADAGALTGALSVGGQITTPNGTAAAPFIAPITETNSGLYRIAGGTLGVSLLGTEVVRFDGGGLQVKGTGAVRVGGGTAATPGFCFVGATDMGMSNLGGDLALSAAGLEGMRVMASDQSVRAISGLTVGNTTNLVANADFVVQGSRAAKIGGTGPNYYTYFQTDSGTSKGSIGALSASFRVQALSSMPLELFNTQGLGLTVDNATGNASFDADVGVAGNLATTGAMSAATAEISGGAQVTGGGLWVKGQALGTLTGAGVLIDNPATGTRIGAYDADLAQWQTLYLNNDALTLEPGTTGATFAGPLTASSDLLLSGKFQMGGAATYTFDADVGGSYARFSGLGGTLGSLTFTHAGSAGSQITFNTQGAYIANNGGGNNLLQFGVPAGGSVYFNVDNAAKASMDSDGTFSLVNIKGATTNGLMTISGSSSGFTFGANIQLFAENNATSPMDMVFRSGSNEWLHWYNGAQIAQISVSGAELARFDGNGLDVTGAVRVDAGSAAYPGLRFRTDTTSGLYSIASGILGVAALGAEQARFDGNTGNTTFAGNIGTTANLGLGINSTAPAVMLDVDTGNHQTLACTMRGRSAFGLVDRGALVNIANRSTVSNIGLLIEGTSGQTGDLIQVRSVNAGVADLFAVSPAGDVTVGGNLTAGSASITGDVALGARNDGVESVLQIGAQANNNGGLSTLQFFAGNGTLGNGFKAQYVKDATTDELRFVTGGLVSLLTLQNVGNAALFAGPVTVGGDLTIGDLKGVRTASDTGNLNISGGSSSTTGANIQLFGGNQATTPNYLNFRIGTTIVGQFNPSVNLWDFGPYNMSVGGLFTASGGATVQATANSTVTNALDLKQLDGTLAGGVAVNAGGIVGWNATNYHIFNIGGTEVGRFDAFGLGLSSKFVADGGAKLSVQNAVDGTSAYGLWLWSSLDSSYAIYMASAGAGKSLANGIAAAALDGRVGVHVRNRVYNHATQGYLWENSTEIALMSLTADTGDLYTLGSVNAGAGLTVGGDITRSDDTGVLYVSGGSAVNSGANVVSYAGTHATQAGDMYFRDGSSAWFWYDADAVQGTTGVINIYKDTNFNNNIAANVGTFATVHSTGNVAVDGILRLGAPTTLTIAAGVVTITKSLHDVDTEAAAATDTLTRINGGVDGDELTLVLTNGTRIVTINNSDNIRLASGTFTFATTDDTITFVNRGGVWREKGRSINS